jgi:MerR family redox-sensitive transcriptional activator SoxR
MLTKELGVGQVSARTGVPVSTLHYYESFGLISSNRTAGNQRRYERHVIRRLSLISFAQELGVPLKEIRQALSVLPMTKAPTMAQWEKMAKTWEIKLDRRIARMQRLKDNLSGCIGCGCLSLRRCVIYNRNDIRGDEGPGPRTLISG